MLFNWTHIIAFVFGICVGAVGAYGFFGLMAVKMVDSMLKDFIKTVGYKV